MPVWIATFLGWLFGGLVDRLLSVLNLFTKSFAVGGLIGFNVVIATSIFTFVTSIAMLLYSIYNLLVKFFGYINEATGSSGSDIVYVSFSVIKTLGIWQAFCDSFEVIGPIIFSFFSLIALKISIKRAKEARDAYYKSVSLMTNSPKSNRIKKK